MNFVIKNILFGFLLSLIPLLVLVLAILFFLSLFGTSDEEKVASFLYSQSNTTVEQIEPKGSPVTAYFFKGTFNDHKTRSPFVNAIDFRIIKADVTKIPGAEKFDMSYLSEPEVVTNGFTIKTPKVYTPISGKVIFAGKTKPTGWSKCPSSAQNYDKNDIGPYGNSVVIENDEYRVRFAHLAYVSTELQVGDEVGAGTVIGAIGNSGCSSGPHLHYEVYKSRGLLSFGKKPLSEEEYTNSLGNIVPNGGELLVDHVGFNTTTLTNSIGEMSIDKQQIALKIESVAKAKGMNPNFLKAIAFRETGWTPVTLAIDGGLGIMQFMPLTGQGYGLVSNSIIDKYNSFGSINSLMGYLSLPAGHGCFHNCTLASCGNYKSLKDLNTIKQVGCDIEKDLRLNVEASISAAADKLKYDGENKCKGPDDYGCIAGTYNGGWGWKCPAAMEAKTVDSCVEIINRTGCYNPSEKNKKRVCEYSVGVRDLFKTFESGNWPN